MKARSSGRKWHGGSGGWIDRDSLLPVRRLSSVKDDERLGGAYCYHEAWPVHPVDVELLFN